MPVQRLTKDDFAEIYRRVLPPMYVAPLDEQDDGIGMDLPYAFAAMAELADCASNKGTQSYFLRPHSDQTDEPATGDTTASGVLLMRREGYSGGDITIPRGTIVEAHQTDSYGEDALIGRYRTTEPVTVLSGNGSYVDLPIEAEYPGYFGNLPEQGATFRFADQGHISVPCIAVLAPPTVFHREASAIEDPWTDFWDPSLLGRYVVIEGDGFDTPDLQTPRQITIVTDSYNVTVSPDIADTDLGKPCIVRILEPSELGLVLYQPVAIEGGRGGMLDARAVDMGTSRLAGEPDPALIARLETLDDTTSLPAIKRAVDRILSLRGIAWMVLEASDPQGLGGRVWDLHPWDFGSMGMEFGQSGVNGVHRAVWLSRSQTRRFFVVLVSAAIIREPFLAGHVWTTVNSIRALGVGFCLKIDNSL